QSPAQYRRSRANGGTGPIVSLARREGELPRPGPPRLAIRRTQQLSAESFGLLRGRERAAGKADTATLVMRGTAPASATAPGLGFGAAPSPGTPQSARQRATALDRARTGLPLAGSRTTKVW